MASVRRELLEEAAQFNQRFFQDNRDDPALRAKAADASVRLGNILSMLGDNERAEAALRRAIELYDELPIDSTNQPVIAAKWLNAWGNLGNVLIASQRLAEAESVYKHVQKLAARLPEDVRRKPGFQHGHASLLQNLAICQCGMGRYEEAESNCRDAVGILRSVPENLDHTEAISRLANVINTWAVVLKKLGRFPQARSAYEEAIELQKKLVAKSPASPNARAELATTHRNLAGLLADLTLVTDAETHFTIAREFQDQLVKDFPEVPVYQSELGVSLEGLAIVSFSRGELEQARKLLDQAITHQKAALKPDASNTKLLRYLASHYDLRARASLEMKDHDAASQAALDLAGIGLDAINFYLPSHFTIDCLLLARLDPKLTDAERRDHERKYALQAIEILRKGLQKGLLDVNHFAGDKKLDPLRSYAEFQELEREFGASKKAGD
jgi:tetratricopeptide (TPR) repeat protein